jgi:hypothetical protein
LLLLGGVLAGSLRDVRRRIHDPKPGVAPIPADIS